MEDSAPKPKRGPGRPKGYSPKAAKVVPAEVDQLVAEHEARFEALIADRQPLEEPLPTMADLARPKQQPKQPAKIPYRDLSEQLCDVIIDATEGYDRGSRFAVCSAALKYALRLIGPRFVKRTSRAAA